MSQIQLLRNSDQVPLANQMGTQFGELSLAKIGQPLKQLLTGNQAQHHVRKPPVWAVWRAARRAHTPGEPSYLPAYFPALTPTPWSHRSGPRDIYPAYPKPVPVAIPPLDQAEQEMHRWTCASRPRRL